MTTSSKHLGLPLLMRRFKFVAFEDLHRRIESKISGWKGKLLFQARRSMLIKSVAASIPIYCMSSF